MKYSILVLSTILLSISVSAQSSLNVTFKSNLNLNDALNDIWGWADTVNNKEYALVGKETGVAIVDVTDPTNPILKHTIDGVESVWRDLKTYDHFAYVIHDTYSPNGSIDTTDGILIIDLSTIDSSNITYTHFYPTITRNGNTETFDVAHNVYVDEQGVLYTFGGNLSNGGAVFYDLTVNPSNPQVIGYFDSNYLHDGFVRGDTMWGAAIYEGDLQAINILNPSNPVILGSVETPSTFCHNVWVSDDNKYAFATDEKPNAYVTAYDVTDPANMVELDRIQSSYGSNVIPHNAYYYNGYVVNSYYTSGLQIVDAHIPGNMVEIGFFDTNPKSGDTFDGAWGAYPYLPSGNILVTDRQTGLFVFEPNYVRATYLHVTVLDASNGNPVPTAQCELIGGAINQNTDLLGFLFEGQEAPGTYQLVTSKVGYPNDTTLVNLQRGVVDTVTVMLGANVGLMEKEVNEFSMYPNPSSGEINIELPLTSHEVKVSIFDIQGKKVYASNFSNRKTFGFNPQLKAGVYMVTVSDGIHKLVPQKLIIR